MTTDAGHVSMVSYLDALEAEMTAIRQRILALRNDLKEKHDECELVLTEWRAEVNQVGEEHPDWEYRNR